jgi:hypothetical protein
VVEENLNWVSRMNNSTNNSTVIRKWALEILGLDEKSEGLDEKSEATQSLKAKEGKPDGASHSALNFKTCETTIWDQDLDLDQSL